MVEIWKDLAGYEKFYEVSNLGRIKSKPRKVSGSHDSVYVKPSRILKPQKNNHGYLRYRLTLRNTEEVRLYAHRAVAITFIPNPHNKPHVNHIDFNPLNNNVNNLEWCTPKENTQHSINAGRFDKSFADTNKKFEKSRRALSSRKLKGTNVKTGEVRYYNSLSEAAKDFKGAKPDISSCCTGVRKTARGYSWEYTE